MSYDAALIGQTMIKAFNEGKVKRKQVIDIKKLPYINSGKLWVKIKKGLKTHETTD